MLPHQFNMNDIPKRTARLYHLHSSDKFRRADSVQGFYNPIFTEGTVFTEPTIVLLRLSLPPVITVAPRTITLARKHCLSFSNPVSALIQLTAIAVTLIAFWLFALPAAAGETAQITDRGSHYEVTLDFESGASHRQVGEAYGRAIRHVVPRFEELWDSYVKEYGGNWLIYRILLHRVRQLKPQLSQEYRDEIEGIASQLSGGTHNEPGDGKVSVDELYLLNLIGDSCRMNQCCAVSVFGNRSSTGQTICGRNLDWPDGSKNQLAQIQSVVTYKFGERSLVSIGCLGFQGIVSGFNKKGVFAGVLDSGTGTKYSAAGRRSYVFDLRTALQESSSLEEVSQALTTEGPYTFNHIIMLGDRRHSAVLENNFSGGGDQRRRALRYWNSTTHPSFGWDISEAVGTVNCFALQGNTDNHIDPADWLAAKQGKENSDINTPRWESMKQTLKNAGPIVSTDGIKSVLSFYHPETRGNIYRGDLYNSFTFQSMVFEPRSMSLAVAFRPRAGGMPARPNYEKIPVEFQTMCRQSPYDHITGGGFTPSPSIMQNSDRRRALFTTATAGKAPSLDQVLINVPGLLDRISLPSSNWNLPANTLPPALHATPLPCATITPNSFKRERKRGKVEEKKQKEEDDDDDDDDESD